MKEQTCKNPLVGFGFGPRIWRNHPYAACTSLFQGMLLELLTPRTASIEKVLADSAA